MQTIDGAPVYSATDLVGYLACQHLTALEQAALQRLVPLPRRFDADLEVLRQRGFEHEQRYRAELEAQGKRVIEILPDGSVTDIGERLRGAAQATTQAMADRWDVIYQGTFFDGHWRGHPDFLLRVDDPERPSRFGAYHYEVADTKLARRAKAGAVLQICSYVDQLERVQMCRPARLHVVLGGSARRTESLRVDDFMAYFRAARERFEVALAEGVLPARLATAPEPVDHCVVCRWDARCDDHRRRVDHLSLVAGISARQRRALAEHNLGTLEALGRAAAPFDPPIPGLSRPGIDRVREQARIQLEGRETGTLRHELLPVEPAQGLASLPAPSPGDLFFDIEGDPYAFDDGLDYLFGVLEPGRTDGEGDPLFHAIWSTAPDGVFSLEGEKRAFEALIDLIMDRLAADPTLHVYHYAPYEPTALKRLMGRYGTREAEVDRLLRGRVLVDLYRAVRQGVRASVESYSIKKIEAFYGYRREVELRDATSSIVEFERWLQLGTAAQPGADHLDRIRLYNRDDVLSTWKLRDWLEERRAVLELTGVVPRPAPTTAEPTSKLNDALEQVAAVAERLTVGVSPDPGERTSEEQARWLLAQLLSWHRREEKSTWWQYYHLKDDFTDEERIDEKETLGGLEFVEVVGQIKRSQVYRYHFPSQEHGLAEGCTVNDPATGKSAGELVKLDDAERFVDLVRGKGNDAPHPKSLVRLDHVNSDVLSGSLLRLGEWVAAHGMEGDGQSRAARELLLRARPRLSDAGPATPDAALQLTGENPQDAAIRLGLALDQSVLPIQGPPGAGKTFTGAKMIAALLANGRRVGITANSHKVIGNLLTAVCREAAGSGVAVRVMQKASKEDVCQDPSVTRAESNQDVDAALAAGTANLIAGTAWLWARPEMAAAVDVLFIDEAGQFSLANAVAVAPAAQSLVLLGDPLQLDQPVKGVHPPGVAVSALEHLLGDVATMPPDRGLFLAETWRLHPDLCRFTSAAFYENKLTPEGQLAGQRIVGGPGAGVGPWIIHVPHAGNDSSSEEEAALVARMAREFVEGGATWVDRTGKERPVGWADVLIVAAYNAQVGLIQRLLPSAARVGTVDKFQGQEAPVSFYSMASSSAADAPRGMSFLYNRHRLNVATSRARCIAITVCSPELLRVQARTIEEMRMANALCQFAECAQVMV